MTSKMSFLNSLKVIVSSLRIPSGMHTKLIKALKSSKMYKYLARIKFEYVIIRGHEIVRDCLLAGNYYYDHCRQHRHRYCHLHLH